MSQPSALVRASDAIADAYRTDTRLLMARRIPVASALFLVVIGGASGLEYIHYPERAVALTVAYAFYLLVSLLQFAIVRRRPQTSVAVTEVVVFCLALGLSAYYGAVQGGIGVLLLSLVLLVTGVAVLYPWGLRGQLIASAGPLVGYPLALALGGRPDIPVAYEVFGLLVAVGVGGLGSYIVDRHRFATFQHERSSAVLVAVGSALDATIRDPQALAERLTEETRVALGADWGLLYLKRREEPVFRAVALSGVPSPVAEEMRAAEFTFDTAPNFLRTLDAEGFLERVPAPGDQVPSSLILQRWTIATLALQAIRRERETIGALACCYTARRRGLDDSERRLLAAIANQAAMALENARVMEEARQANQLKSEFVATLSHEVRTPLSVILGYTDLLVEDEDRLSNTERRDMLQRIREQSTQLNDLIGAMLDLNRLETRRLPITISSFAVGDLLRGLRQGIPAGWVKEGVTIEWRVCGGETEIRTDRGKLEMILRNLIHNALKYTDRGRVVVSAEPCANEGRIVFGVQDTGSGIAPEDQSAIFEMFRQGSANESRGGGVGLGLHLVKRFTEVLGGEVTLVSRVGEGARFLVSLPLDAPRRIAKLGA